MPIGDGNQMTEGTGSGKFTMALMALMALMGLILAACAETGTPPPEPDQRRSTPAYDSSGLTIGELDVLADVRTDDLDALIGKGVIRVLVSYNTTNYKVTDSQARGFEYELMMKYRAYLRTRVNPRSWPVQFVFIPLPADELLPTLIEGRGDIVAAGLTVTPERSGQVAFTRPYIRNVAEVIVAAPGATGLETLEDLSGREIHVRAGSSYVASLNRLNEDFAKRGLAPAQITMAHEHLATEDIIELVHADALALTVVDTHLAELWSKVFPDLIVRDDLRVAEGGEIAWAIRKNSPQMLDSLDTFLDTAAQGTLIGNILLRRYFLDATWFENPLDDESRQKLDEITGLLAKYAERYDFDWRLLAALAFQESEFNHSARSKAGAVGLMQVLPSTVAAPPIEIPDVEDLEANVEAGAKYLAHLRDAYFNDPDISESARVDFALAAYNGGPTRISRLRGEAEKEGLDPNRWFDNVEKIARRRIGLETVQYVSSINRYYIEFVLVDRAEEQRRQGREAQSG